MIPETITYQAAAARYGCHPEAIRKAVRAKRIAAYSPTRIVQLDVSEADAWFVSTRLPGSNKPLPSVKPETIYLADAMARYGVGKTSIMAAINSGLFDAYKPGKKLQVDVAQADAWFLSQRVIIRTGGRPRGRRSAHGRRIGA
jgi:hypothetical protein